MMIDFTAFGKAAPSGSKTVGFTKGGQHFVRDSSRGAAEWKRTVAQVGGAAMVGLDLLQGPLSLYVEFVVGRPKGHFGKNGLLPSAPPYPAVKPDITKLLRAVEDALTGIVWRDDSQIVTQTATKIYGEPARVRVRVYPAEPLEDAEPLTVGDVLGLKLIPGGKGQ